MTISLFDFEEEGSLNRVQEVFKLLQQEFKNTNNPFSKSINDLPSRIKPYLQHFEEEGWIKLQQGISKKR